jgi:hypothetical protein
MANTSVTFGLEPGYIYSLQGKLIAPNDGTTPVFQYYPDLHRLVCKAEDLIGETITKTFIHSYGVVSVVEKDIKYNSGVAENILNVIMGHNDWDLDVSLTSPYIDSVILIHIYSLRDCGNSTSDIKSLANETLSMPNSCLNRSGNS